MLFRNPVLRNPVLVSVFVHAITSFVLQFWRCLVLSLCLSVFLSVCSSCFPNSFFRCFFGCVFRSVILHLCKSLSSFPGSFCLALVDRTAIRRREKYTETDCKTERNEQSSKERTNEDSKKEWKTGRETIKKHSIERNNEDSEKQRRKRRET